MNRRPRLVAGLVTVGVLALTGCTASGPRPGVAVTVDDEVVTTETINLASRGLCSFFADEVEQQGAVAYSGIRRNVAALLALRTAVTQLADEVGVEPDSDYRRQESSLEQETADLQPADEREALLRAISSEPYVLGMVPTIGEQLLVDEGEVDPGLEASGTRGLEALTDYLAGADVEFAPSLELAYRDVDVPANAQVEQVVGSLFDTEATATSVGVSEIAEQARAEDAAEYTASLPASQRCGG